MVLSVLINPPQHRAFLRAGSTGMWRLRQDVVSKISEVLCTRSGGGPVSGTSSISRLILA